MSSSRSCAFVRAKLFSNIWSSFSFAVSSLEIVEMTALFLGPSIAFADEILLRHSSYDSFLSLWSSGWSLS